MFPPPLSYNCGTEENGNVFPFSEYQELHPKDIPYELRHYTLRTEVNFYFYPCSLYNKVIMLKLSGSLLNQSVMSLRTGGAVAFVESAIINPHNLKIEGFYCLDSRSKQRLILLIQDIRDIVPQGIVVDDHDVLVEPEELVRLQQVLKLNYQIIGKLVQSVNKQKLGKANDYAVDDTSFFVQKLYIERSLLKSISSSQLVIDRAEIVEVTDKRIVIKELQKPVKAGVPAAAPAL